MTDSKNDGTLQSCMHAYIHIRTIFYSAIQKRASKRNMLLHTDYLWICISFICFFMYFECCFCFFLLMFACMWLFSFPRLLNEKKYSLCECDYAIVLRRSHGSLFLSYMMYIFHLPSISDSISRLHLNKFIWHIFFISISNNW